MTATTQDAPPTYDFGSGPIPARQLPSGAWAALSASIGAGASIGERAIIGEWASIRTTRDAVVVGPVGSRRAYLSAYRMPDNSVRFSTGCFSGTLAELLAACDVTHGPEHQHTLDYRALATLAHATLTARLAGAGEGRTP